MNRILLTTALVFAVRAVDQAGHRSLAVMPRPNRERAATYDARPGDDAQPQQRQLRRPQAEQAPPQPTPPQD